MPKILWSTGLLVAISLGQTYQFSVQRADSSAQIIIEPSDFISTDVLQESLYVQLLMEINNPRQEITTALPQNKFQLLQRGLQYYPKAVFRGDTLIIPYPAQKVERFKEIRYFIPIEYFAEKGKIASLQPEIKLYLDPDKSTLMINNSYRLSYYRSPGIKNKSLQQSKKVLQYIFNLLLPYTNKIKKMTGYENKAVVHYKGYKEHTIQLGSKDKFYAFWESLCGQGSLYFFPSKIDDLEKQIIVYGLLYVMKDDILNAYHFGELTVAFSKQQKRERVELQLDFYPFIMNKQIAH
jgi:hypothetical protein